MGRISHRNSEAVQSMLLASSSRIFSRVCPSPHRSIDLKNGHFPIWSCIIGKNLSHGIKKTLNRSFCPFVRPAIPSWNFYEIRFCHFQNLKQTLASPSVPCLFRLFWLNQGESQLEMLLHTLRNPAYLVKFHLWLGVSSVALAKMSIFKF